MDEKTILIGVLTKTLNRSEQEVTELLYQEEGGELTLKEGAMDEILSLDSVRVENIKKNAPIDPERLKNEYGRGKKEALDGFEKALKEKYSIDTDKQGVELVDSILAAKSKPTKMTDDEVKKHPLYLELEKSRVPKDEHQKVKDEYEQYKKDVKRNEKFGQIKQLARTKLHEMNPIVSETASVARTREEDFLKKFEAYDYQLDGDSHVVLRPDGTRMEDDHGNVLPFDEFVRRIAVMNYDFPKQDEKGGTGGNEQGTKKPVRITVPKTEEEYVKAYHNAATLEEKVAIKEAYHANK